MNIRLACALASAGLALLPAVCLPAAEARIALVSMERLFDDYHKTKTANLQLKSRFEDMDARRRDLIEAVRGAKQRVETLGTEARDKSLNDDARDRKRAAAEDAFVAFREAEGKLAEFDSGYKKQFGEQMKATQQQLVGEIRAVIAAYAREHGFTLVLDGSGKTLNSVETVVYAEPALDVTEAILAILNKHAAAPAAAPRKTTP